MYSSVYLCVHVVVYNVIKQCIHIGIYNFLTRARERQRGRLLVVVHFSADFSFISDAFCLKLSLLQDDMRSYAALC